MNDPRPEADRGSHRRAYWIGGVIALILAVGGTWWLVALRGIDAEDSGRFPPVQGSRYEGLEDIVAAMNEGGLACKGLNVSGSDQTEEVGAEFGFCKVGAQTVNIHVYEDADEVLRHIKGNFSVRDEGNPNYFPSGVYGTNWVVDTYSVQTSIRAKQALGGEIY